MKINRTTQRTIEILELIAASDEDLTLNDIAKTLAIPKTSAFDILETLVQLDMLYIREHRLKTYAIGVKAYVIGNTYSKTSLLLNTSTPIIKELSEQTGLSVLIAKENNHEIIYTLKQEPTRKIIATPEIGETRHLHSTGAGKAILAFSKDRTKLLNKLSLPALTKKTITSKEELNNELMKIQNQGYGISNGENEEHTFSIGAPLFDYNGKVSASIEIVGLYRENYDPIEDIELVKQAAQRISIQLGWTPPKQ